MAFVLPKLIVSNKLILSSTSLWGRHLPQLINANTRLQLQQQQQRDSSFRSSQIVQDLDKYPDVEVVQNPPEWKYVERLLPVKVIPKPIAKAPCPSGWQPPKPEAYLTHGYHVARTKNHMVPVYLHTKFRGQRRLTIVKLIQGDIWALERDLRVIVEEARKGKICASRINELSGQIHFHGDYVDVIREHLKAKGF